MDAPSIDLIVKPYMNILQQQAVGIRHAAVGLFYYLAIIELTFAALWMVLAGEGLERLFNKLVCMMFNFAFFYACIQYGDGWVTAIVNGFIDVGSASGTISLSPVSVINTGARICLKIMTGMDSWGILGAIYLALFCTVMSFAFIIIYALIATEIVVTLVKSYVLASLSSLFFAFAGNEITREMTVKYVQTVFSVGLHLMTLYFVVGVGQGMSERWYLTLHVAMQEQRLMPIFGIFSGLIVYFVIVRTMPGFISGLAGGARLQNYSGHAIATAASVAWAAHKVSNLAPKIAPKSLAPQSSGKNSTITNSMNKPSPNPPKNEPQKPVANPKPPKDKS